MALPDVNQKVRTNKLALCKKGFLKDKCQMQRKQKMLLSQLALVPYEKDEKRPRRASNRRE